MVSNIWTLAITQELFIPFKFQALLGISTLQLFVYKLIKAQQNKSFKSHSLSLQKQKTPETINYHLT